MATNRDWMYRMDTFEFYEGIDEFVEQAQRFARSRGLSDGTIQCPCTKCKNRKWKGPEDVKYDLYRYGFIPNYYTWIVHGEKRSLRPDPPVQERVVCRVMPMYTGGSVSIPQHRWLLRKELKREPTAMELFIRTYISKNDRFVVDAAKETSERYHKNYDANGTLDAESENVCKKYRRGVDLVVSKKDIELDHVGSKNDIEVENVCSKNGIEVDNVGSKNDVEVDHVCSKNDIAVDDVGPKNDVVVEDIGSKNKVEVDHVCSKNDIEVDDIGSMNEIEVDGDGSMNEIEVDHVGSKNAIKVNHVCLKNDIEVDDAGFMNKIEAGSVGSKNAIEVNHVGSKNDIEVDDASSMNEIDNNADSKNQVSDDHVDSKNEVSIDHAGSKNKNEVENGFQCIDIDTPSIHTSVNEELVHIREMRERQQVAQKLLRDENEHLRATQLAQTQKLDQVMQSQKSFEENIRCLVAQEMEKATQKLLSALQNLSRG